MNFNHNKQRWVNGLGPSSPMDSEHWNDKETDDDDDGTIRVTCLAQDRTLCIDKSNLAFLFPSIKDTCTHIMKIKDNLVYSPVVVNISSRNLSDTEMSLLSKGLHFCPTPGEPVLAEKRQDLDNLHDKLRWKQRFLDDPSNQSVFDRNIALNKAVKKPGVKKGPTGSSYLETFANNNEMDLSKSTTRAPRHQNLSQEEKQNIKTLRSDDNIVIKPADKGGAIVIMDTDDYIREAERQLTQENFYTRLDHDPTAAHNEEINDYIAHLQSTNQLTKNTAAKLRTQEARAPYFYLLPKIHKDIRPPPGRPIVSGNGCATEKISALADLILNPLVPLIPSYVRDTTDFLSKLKQLSGDIPTDALLCTLDVTSLYTNIPHNEAIDSTKYWMEKNRTEPRPGTGEPTNSAVLHLIKLVLTKNNFVFNGTHYIQIGGTAMGTRVAPTIANLFMGRFEDQYVYNCDERPLIWLRYIDDIFLIWTHGRPHLEGFIAFLNEVHASIKFTSHISDNKVSFLDTIITKEGNALATDLYTKPTDANNYLHYDSAHPPHCKKGIPYGQFLRIRRICSKPEDFKRHCLTKAAHFATRGYPLKEVAEALHKAASKPEADLTCTRKPPEEEAIVLVTTYHPSFNDTSSITRRNWDILAHSAKTQPLHKLKLIIALRKPPNLRSMLVRAKTDHAQNEDRRQEIEQRRTDRICKTPECLICQKLDTSGTITSPVTGRNYMSRKNVTCLSTNLIYCLSCSRCKMQYVGQTKRRLLDRMKEHLSKIRNHKLTNDIGRHFNTNGHQGTQDVTFHIIDFIHRAPDSPEAQILRHARERLWIHRLRTNIPTGLNLIDAPSYH